jgi:hypothetical protein
MRSLDEFFLVLPEMANIFFFICSFGLLPATFSKAGGTKSLLSLSNERNPENEVKRSVGTHIYFTPGYAGILWF